MTQNVVKTVAFGYLSPDAARVFLEIKHYRVSIYRGDTLPDLDPEARNIVIVPNYRIRDGLAPIADRIHRLLVYRGKEDLGALASLNLPILDSKLEDGVWVQMFPAPAPSEYVREIEEAAVDLKLDAAAVRQKPAPPVSEPKPDPNAADSLEAWLDVLDKFLPSVIQNFDVEVEFPLCQFLVGEAGAADYQNAVRAMVSRGADETLLKSFYLWVRANEPKLGPAIKELLFSDPQPVAKVVAVHYKVSEQDLKTIEAIYYAIKEDDDDGHEQD